MKSREEDRKTPPTEMPKDNVRTLADIRAAKESGRRRAEVARALADVAGVVVTGELSGTITGCVVVVLLGEKEPPMIVHTEMSVAGLKEARETLTDLLSVMGWGVPGLPAESNPSEDRKKRFFQRKIYENKRLIRDLEHQKSNPCICSAEHCSARFKTPRGLKVHERACQDFQEEERRRLDEGEKK